MSTAESRVITQLQENVRAMDEALSRGMARIESMEAQLNALAKHIEAVGDLRIATDSYKESVSKVKEWVTSHIETEFAALAAQVEDVTAKVEGRNKSAPTKRNMTDADAVSVLNGDTASLNHKEAALAIGLTYAQVYSCRGGFTFKHVIHDLEKAGWKNPWEKPQSVKK